MKKATLCTGCLFLVLARLPMAGGATEVIELDIAPNPGQIVQTAYDAERRFIYAGTHRSLYRFRRDGPPGSEQVVEPEPDVRLALAPGGNLYVLLSPHVGADGLFSARLKKLDDQTTVALAADTGFSGLFLGPAGKLLVTRTSLDAPETFRGLDRYTFLAADGSVRQQRELRGPRQSVVDPGGEALLLLGLEDARAYSIAGQELWTIPGAFRYAALGPGGTIAVLNPSPREKIQQLVVRRASGTLESITLVKPVAHLRIAADESFALVVLADARYVLLNLGTLEPSPPRTLPLQDVRLVSDAEIIDGQTLVFGVIHRTPQPPGEERTVIALAGGANQNVLFTRKLPALSETAGLPAIDPATGSRAFVARTDKLSIFVGLDN